MILLEPKRGVLRLIVAVMLTVVLSAAAASALDVPPLTARVNDGAGLLSAGVRRQLETTLERFEKEQSTQIVVLTVASLEGDPIEDFAIRVAEAWKIGQKGLDNGVILVIAKKERKLRIEVGYGLEGRLTDLIASRIIREAIAPSFKKGQFDQGISEGVNAIMAAVKGEFKAAAPPAAKRSSKKAGGFVEPLVIVAALVIMFLGRRHRLIGALIGAGVAPAAGALAGFAGLVTLAVLALIGLVAGLALASLQGYSGGRGGFISSGSWIGSGGGFSSGGFGGGGGGFGGGGASGDW